MSNRAPGTSAPGTRAPGTSTKHQAPSTRHPFDLYIFDLDGTLIDSRRDLTDAVNALLAECGASPLPESRVGRMVGDGAATLVARAFEASGIERPPDALDRFLEIYAHHLTDYTRPYEGVSAVLTACRARGTIAVLTNKPLASTRAILHRLDLSGFFDEALVIGGDGPFARKPDPAGLQWLMQAARVQPERTLLVGDSMIDWRTARAAGVRIAIARYGFGFDGFPAESLDPRDFLIDSPGDVLSL